MTEHTITTTTTTTAATGTTITVRPDFAEAMAALDRSLDSQLLVSQDRCVDGLLDLYNATDHELVRQLVADIIDDIRHLSAVRASTVQGRLAEVSAAVAIEGVFQR